jgi:hypothetical protein
MWYAYEHDEFNMVAIPLSEVKTIMDMNAKGKYPERLEDFALKKENKAEPDGGNDEFELHRFDGK